MGRNLYLIDVLEQLDFIDEGIINVDRERTDPLPYYNRVKESIKASKADI